MMYKISKTLIILTVISIFSTTNIFAQKTKDSSNEKPLIISKVIKIDDVTIKDLLKPKGKPLLVNFWATWCIPCREEFPELVEIDNEYKGKIDFITISLDDLAEINRDVPKFLTEMKATMPAYLLRTNDENAVISSISKDWTGGLPFTVLYNEKGELVYFRQGKIKVDVVKEKLDELLDNQNTQPEISIKNSTPELNRDNYAINFDFDGIKDTYAKGKIDAEKDISEGRLAFITAGMIMPSLAIWKNILNKKHKVYVYLLGCVIRADSSKYSHGYNEVAVAEIESRFGKGILNQVLKQAEEQYTNRRKNAAKN